MESAAGPVESQRNGIPVDNLEFSTLSTGFSTTVFHMENEVKNEVDVMGMHGITPVFISCKNGSTVNVEELYKLRTVAEHFGGSFAGKILVSSVALGEDFHERAKEMEIHVIDGVRKIGEVAFRHALEEVTAALNK